MNILHIDDHIIVLDKPAGLSVLPEGWDKDAAYLIKMLEADYGKTWVVHRLDKVTSGVILFARGADAHRDLSIQFEKHQVEKNYHALVNGNPKWDEHTARHPLRANAGRSHRTVVDNRDGKPSATRLRVLERFGKTLPATGTLHAHETLRATSLLEAVPETGRTHQVRVHSAELGHPLLADALYRAPSTDWIARPALHAFSLTFVHPATREALTFSAPYPADLVSALGKARG